MKGGRGSSNRRHVVGGGGNCMRKEEDIVRGLGEMVTHLRLDF